MCKKISVMTLLLLTLTALAAQAQDSISIEAFGKSGTSVPEVARELLAKDFFSRNVTESMADADNYTASFEIPKHIAVSGMKLDAGAESYTKRIPARVNDLTLRFENHTSRANDILVSAMTDAGEVRNFLVRVETGETLSLNAVSLADFDRLYFISLQEFSAHVDSRLNRSAAKSVELQVRQALTKSGISSCENATAYCSDCNETIEICANGGSCILAHAKRRFDYTSGSHTWYSVDIYYPSSSTKFHSYTSATQASGEPACRSTSIRTDRTDNSGLAHKWTGMDKTLFDGDQSTGECTAVCAVTFTVDRP